MAGRASGRGGHWQLTDVQRARVKQVDEQCWRAVREQMQANWKDEVDEHNELIEAHHDMVMGDDSER